MKILVTGSESQLGKCLQNATAKYPELEITFFNSKIFDITDPEKMTQVFSEQHYDFCINCAAFTDVEQAEKTPEPAFEVNAEAVRRLALACSEYMVTLIHISTDYVFDGEKETPYQTTDKTNPINEYGKSKLLGEKYIQIFLK